MDINSKTLTIFKSFIDDLIKVFPEHKNILIENYSDIISLDKININENDKIKEFLNFIDKISSQITEKNESIFENDLELLKGLNFKTIWNSDISDNTKDKIWKYLQSFYLININVNTLNKLNEGEGKKKISKKNKKDLENFKKINEDFKKMNENFNKNENIEEIDNSLNDFNNVLENTSIGKIAQEISQELNIDDNTEDLSQILNPESMMKIFGTITTKMNNNGDISSDTLQNEAMNICSTMKDNPLFSQLMGMQSTLFEQMMPQQPNPNTRNINVSSNRNTEARNKARRKLDNRKNNKVNVKKSE
tara:strand:+ start:368 stop:1285 length:918 start_codon:yes stop_codon:yes gene_type:complete